MTMTSSNVVFKIDATDPGDQRLSVQIEVSAPFTSPSLQLSFHDGAWFVLLREPIQHVSHLEAFDENGKTLNVMRKDVDSIVIKGIQSVEKVRISYMLLCVDNTVRSNHYDETHLHLMPPFTWFLPTSGIDSSRMDLPHKVEFLLPETWNVSTQMDRVRSQKKGSSKLHTFSVEHRDALFSICIAECNSERNPQVHGWRAESFAALLGCRREHA